MQRFWLLPVFFLCAISGFAQRFTISGMLEDQTTGEKLISANVYDPVSLKGTTSNTYGFYSLTFPAGNIKLTFSYVGYEAVTNEFRLSRDTVINVRLNPVINLDEVVISGERTKSAVKSTQMSMTELTSKTIKSLPVMFGEADILKALQLLPGVKGGSEGTSGIY